MRLPSLAPFLLLAPLAAQSQFPDEALLNRCLGRHAVRIPVERVLDYTWSRRGMTVEFEGRALQAFEGLSNHVTVRKDGELALAFGSLICFPGETTEAVAALADHGADVASLTPRFPGARPQPFELRFYVRGTEARIGAAIAAALAVLDTDVLARAEAAAAVREDAAEWQSEISAAPLEAIFGRKSEEKRGVVLFRFPGPRGLLDGSAGARGGVGTTVAFADRDDRATVRVATTFDRAALGRVVRALGPRGFALDVLVPASPGLDADLLHADLHASGDASELARSLAEEFGDVWAAAELEPVAVKPRGREVLGLDDGKLGDEWIVAATRPAGPTRPRWVVETDADAGPVARMAEFGDADNRTFNLLWNPDLRMQDGRLFVRMRAIDGRLDQGGGLIWRAQDADNYYITRFNPLEQDFRVYRVREGVREQLQAIGELPFAADDWFTIEVEQRGDLIRCTLDGVVVLEVRDTTFPDAGGIGLWSKADSRCEVSELWFDPVVRRKDGTK